eukprot:6078314-Amphidinium_carterae.2
MLTWNINSLSSDQDSERFNSLAALDADILCLVETKKSRGEVDTLTNILRRKGLWLRVSRDGHLVPHTHPTLDPGRSLASHMGRQRQAYGRLGYPAWCERPHLNHRPYAHSSIEGNVHMARDTNRAFLTRLFGDMAEWHQHPVLITADANLDVADPWYHSILGHFIDLQFHYAPTAEGAYPTCFSSPTNPSRIDNMFCNHRLLPYTKGRGHQGYAGSSPSSTLAISATATART